jgi:hypothetical protein
MAIGPDDLAAWLKIPTPTGDALASMEMVIDAVYANIARHYTAPDPVTADWDLAHVMQAARWWKRSASPEGVVGFDDLGAIRISTRDRDVETMLEDIGRTWGFA